MHTKISLFLYQTGELFSMNYSREFATTTSFSMNILAKRLTKMKRKKCNIF
jgi:hypothetical protein